MLAFFIEATVLSLRQPRRGARLVLDNVHGPQGALILFGLALVALCFVVTAQWLLLGPPDMSHLPPDAPEPSLAMLVQGTAAASILSFALITAVVFGVGKLFGGAGDLATIAVVLAWHSLLTAPLAPLVNVPDMTAQGGPEFWRIGLLLFTTWVLICFIAEAHRFASAWRVGGVMAGFVFGLSLILIVSQFGA